MERFFSIANHLWEKDRVCVCVCARASMCTHVHVHACTQSCPILTPWTVAYQALLSVEFFRQDYWSELPFSSPEDLPDAGMESTSPALTGGFFTTEPPRKREL